MATTNALDTEIERLARRPASLVNREYWFPFTSYGALAVAAAAVFARWDPATTSSWLLWAVLGPLAAVATGLWFHRRSDALGVQTRNPAIYVAIAAVGGLGCAVVGTTADERWVFPLILAIVGSLVALLGGLDRDSLVVTVGIGLIALGLLGGLGSVDPAPFNLVVGALLLGAGGARRWLR